MRDREGERERNEESVSGRERGERQMKKESVCGRERGRGRYY